MTPEQFHQFADLLPDPILLVLRSGTILAGNRAAAERLPAPPTQGSSLLDCVREPPSEVEAYLRRCSRSRSLTPGVLTVPSPQGGDVVCRVEGGLVSPRNENQDAIVLLRCIVKDAANLRFLALNEQIDRLHRENRRRREAEENLLRQKEWLRVTLESIGDAVIATDAGGNVVFMNPVAQEYLGWTEQEAAGRPLAGIFHLLNEYSRQRVSDPVAEVLQRGQVVGMANHTILVDRHGHERPIEDSAAPIKDGEGRVLGVIVVFHDVTRQRQAERELREADRRKDEFLATLAHELRNPLAPIRNALEILKHAPGKTDLSQQAHETMERQLHQMVRLIDDLLDVSRITRGTLQLRRARVDLASVLYHAIETCRPMADAAGQQLIVSLPRDPLEVDGDSIRLAQVFTNLLNNACKFTGRDGRIEVRARREDETVIVSVSDNGPGIPADQLTRIFEMFSQVDSTINRSQGGLGIGLTLVKQVVELHGGSVAAQSAGPDQGSEFIVRLPVVPKQRASVVPPLVEGKATPGDRRRILVVDDNRDAATTLALLLKLMGHVTHVAFDGHQALEAAQDFQPEVILLDIGLPQMNGYEVCRRIRDKAWGKHLHIVALTGWGQAEDRLKSAEAGFDAHLVKPVDQAELRSVVSADSRPRSSNGG